MVTYEITATVREDLCAAFERYMRERHVPDIIATGAFSAVTLGRSAPGRYRVRCEAHDRAALDRYLANDAPHLRTHFAETMPEGVDLSREEWTVLASWPSAS